MFNIPPRHSKSETITKKFPSWYLGRHPQEEMMICSYSTDLAKNFSRMSRDILQNYGQGIFGVNVSKSTSAAGEWGIEGSRGMLKAAGVGAGIIGRGFKIGIIDDPIKNQEEALNDELLEKLWEWYNQDFYSRRAPQAAIILVMTRWCENDLAGRIIANDTNKEWLVVDFPAIAEEEDVLGRKQGDVLWPQRFDLDFYLDAKKVMGEKSFQTIYQCNPMPQSGSMIKREWFKTYPVLPEIQYRILSVDCTFKDGPQNDFVSIQCWGKEGPRMYLIDNVKKRLDFPQTIREVEIMRKKWNPLAIYVEDKANGSALISTLSRSVSGIIPVQPHGSKKARVAAISPQIESGNVFLPMYAEWLEDYISEWIKFPLGKHDDQVDSGSQAILKLKDVIIEKSVTKKKDHFDDDEEEDDVEKYLNYGNDF